MEILAIFVSSFVLALSGAMMPGPLFTLALSESAKRGFMAGPLLILGHVLLELSLVLALLSGLAKILTVPSVGSMIAVLGGVFLFYMGYGMARDAYLRKVSLEMPGHGDPSPGEKGEVKTDLHLVAVGAVVSFSNPYWSLWWATVGLGYITLSMKEGTMGLGAFVAGHFLADLLWYSLIAGAVTAGRKILSPTIYRGILVACGIFLVWLGGMFVYKGFTGIT
ncbi:MAG: LysE family transporter [Bacillota bacterium]